MQLSLLKLNIGIFSNDSLKYLHSNIILILCLLRLVNQWFQNEAVFDILIRILFKSKNSAKHSLWSYYVEIKIHTTGKFYNGNCK